MYIKKISIKNFRLLEDVELLLEKKTTIIVGRNNSGKTSLTELFHRLLDEKSPAFFLEDFSLCAHEKFWTAFEMFEDGREHDEVRLKLPVIEVKLTVSYDATAMSFGPLSDFIIDLNPDCHEACILIRYDLKDGAVAKLFENISLDPDSTLDQKKSLFFREMKEGIRKQYFARILAEDPNDNTNQKIIEWQQLNSLLQSNFINAQRGLDEVGRKDGADSRKNNVLGSILEHMFTTATNSNSPSDKSVVSSLESAIKNIQAELDTGFNVKLGDLLPTFQLFGYPGLSDPNLKTETILDVQKLLRNHTRVQYAGINGINLPESHNGLGSRNLIYILLQLFQFYKDYLSSSKSHGIHMVFIEEPEAHLHPQMQEVFISKIDEIAKIFSESIGGSAAWPVQFIVTTHSPHMANKAPFESMRYFLTKPHSSNTKLRKTIIKDLKKGLESIPVTDKEFLHKYMTLTKCDLLFADKVILVEGATERILLPQIIAKVDASFPQSPNLSSQYVSVMEVGGAYAHIFFDLLDFLDLSTLIVTDLDSISADNKACPVSDGVKTSNQCIIKWFNDSDIAPATLIAKNENSKIKNIRRLAYQIPELPNTGCGRSFEDAFIIANTPLFDAELLSASEIWIMAQSFKKTTFAVKYGVENLAWEVPLYLKQGLHWLAISEKDSDTNEDVAVIELPPVEEAA